MSHVDPYACWIAGSVAAALAAFGWYRYLSPNAKERRRRHRSYGQIMVKGKRPMVKLNVRKK